MLFDIVVVLVVVIALDLAVDCEVECNTDCVVELDRERVGSLFRVNVAAVVVTKLSFTQSVLRFDSPLASFHLPSSIEKNST